MWKFTLTPLSVQFPNLNSFWYKIVVPEWDQKKEYYSFNIYTNSKENHQRKRRRRHYKQLLLLMRCKIINLPVLKFRAKRVKTSIDKEQMFPTVSNLNELDALTRNIRLWSRKVCKIYWKHIYSVQNSVCILTPVEIKITNHVIKKGIWGPYLKGI